MSGQVTPHDHPGFEIRERREALGLSREWLAYESGCSLKTIERLEQGKGKPRRATLSVIESALAPRERRAIREAA